MAGLDHDFSGEAWLADGARVGFLAQEPELDPTKDVLGNVMEGVAATKALLDRFDEVSAKFGDPDADMDALMAEQAELQEQIDAVQGWELQRTLDIAMDALRCPPGDQDVSHALGRRAAPGRAVPPAAAAARPAAAGRADQSPGCRIGRLARALPPGLPRHRGRDHPRPLLPRQCRRLDPGARPRPRHSLAGQLQLVARAEAEASRPGGEGRRSRASRRSRVSWNGSGRARARVRPRARRASPRMRIC